MASIYCGLPRDDHCARFRDECLNVSWFASLAEAQRLIETWRRDYNECRPHMAHNGRTPMEFSESSGMCHACSTKTAAGF
ncbi:transposase [Rhodobacteraceae bacterium NNCM2]|nr:transposase [Coraliihabitans acroporae]